MSHQTAFESFMSESFESACDSSTEASWGGGGYSVELFEDGHYRVLCDNQIGNKYKSTGLILAVPAIDSEEWDEYKSSCFYDNASKEMRDTFDQAAADLRAYAAI